MKKKFLLLFASIVSVSLFVSCNKEMQMEDNTSMEEHEVIFETVGLLTKTAIDVSADTPSITWENTPVSYIHLFEDGVEGNNPKINVENLKKATFSASFPGITKIGPTYHAVIASDFKSGVATIPAVQNPTATSFDPAADILVSSDNKYLQRNERVLLSFSRLVAISKLVLKGMEPGEKVEIVKITGSNTLAGALKPLQNNEFSGYEKDGSKTITLKFKANNTVSQDGTFETFFVSEAVAPGSFSVAVATDRKVYSKSASAEAASSLKFSFDMLKDIVVNLEGQDLPQPRYELVTSAPSSWAGKYIVVNTDAPGAAKALNAVNDKLGYVSDVTVLEAAGKKYIEVSDDMKAFVWTVSNSGRKSGNDILWNVTVKPTTYSVKYLFDDNGLTISSSNYRSMKYHYHKFIYDKGVQMTSFNGSDDTFLGCSGTSYSYSSDNTSRVYLYKYSEEARESQVLSFDKAEVRWPLCRGKYEKGKTYEGQALSAKSSYQPSLLSYTSSNPEVATVDKNGNITIVAEGSTTITAVASGNMQYSEAVASYDLEIFAPYYQKISSTAELTNGSKYLLVSKTSLLGNWYHAFSATTDKTFSFDLNKSLFSDVVYDNGNKIKATEEVDANQLTIENSLLSGLSKMIGLNGSYTIKPVSVEKYLYCNMGTSEILDSMIPLATYNIAFADINLSGLSLAEIIRLINQIATIPHSITFNEEGSVVVKSATSDILSIGANLCYVNLLNSYAYVNMSMFDALDNIDDLLARFGKDSEYAWLLNLIKMLGDNVSIKDIVSYLSADMYLYKYIGE